MLGILFLLPVLIRASFDGTIVPSQAELLPVHGVNSPSSIPTVELGLDDATGSPSLRRKKQVVINEDMNVLIQFRNSTSSDLDDSDEYYAQVPPGMNPLLVHYGEEAMIARDGEPVMLLGVIAYSIACLFAQYHGGVYLYELYNYYFGSE